MPLTMFRSGDVCMIKKLYGNDDVCRHLADMGFVAGETIKVISETAGGFIVELKGSRLALNETMASKLFLEEGGDRH